MGVNDAQNPNNEFMEITLDPRYVTTPSFDMTGFVLHHRARIARQHARLGVSAVHPPDDSVPAERAGLDRLATS